MMHACGQEAGEKEREKSRQMNGWVCRASGSIVFSCRTSFRRSPLLFSNLSYSSSPRSFTYSHIHSAFTLNGCHFVQLHCISDCLLTYFFSGYKRHALLRNHHRTSSVSYRTQENANITENSGPNSRWRTRRASPRNSPATSRN